MTSTKVLIAEDESLIRLDLKESLEELGYEVVGEATNGSEAIMLAEELMPDVVLMDIKMPHVDGLQATREIIDRKYSAVIVLTAFSQRELVDEACEAGALAYLVKPFQQRELTPTIELALFRFREHVLMEEQVDSLHEQLETRKIVDRAKGKLMDDFGLNEHTAFRFIQKNAMSNSITMHSSAEQVLQGDIKPQSVMS